MSKRRGCEYKKMLTNQIQQNQQLSELEKKLEETNKKLDEMTSLLKAIVVNYILSDLEDTIQK
mgnify:CR=1 FL=1